MRASFGFTLIELVMSMTIIGIALLGTLLAINTAVLFSGDPMISEQAIAIADSYLQEIVSKNFPTTGAAPCPAPSVTRSSFTNICDYHGINQNPTDQNGNAIAALNAYIVQVVVDTQAASLGALTSGTAVVRVDVSVSHALMTPLKFTVYRSNY